MSPSGLHRIFPVAVVFTPASCKSSTTHKHTRELSDKQEKASLQRQNSARQAQSQRGPYDPQYLSVTHSRVLVVFFSNFFSPSVPIRSSPLSLSGSHTHPKQIYRCRRHAASVCLSTSIYLHAYWIPPHTRAILSVALSVLFETPSHAQAHGDRHTQRDTDAYIRNPTHVHRLCQLCSPVTENLWHVTQIARSPPTRHTHMHAYTCIYTRVCT